MTVRRVRSLTPRDLGGLELCTGLAAEDPWARDAMDSWGLCGVSLSPSTWLLLAPAASVPDGHPLHEHADTPHAALLALQVEPGLRRSGLGRQLVQTAAARLHGQVPVIEAAGSRLEASAFCPPAAWLQAVGFAPLPHFELLPGGAQRLHLQLGRTVRWPRVRLDRVLQRLLRWAPDKQPGWQTPRDADTDQRSNAAPLTS